MSDPCAIYHVTEAIMYKLATPLDAPLPLRDLAVSNLHKQHSLIATSKISYCLPQLQITKSKNFFACDHKFQAPPQSTSKEHPFLTDREKSKGTLSIPGATQENLCIHPLEHKILVPWIPIRNKKMKSYTHPVSHILELN